MRPNIFLSVLVLLAVVAGGHRPAEAQVCAPVVAAAGQADYRFGSADRAISGRVLFPVALAAAPVINATVESQALTGDDRQAAGVVIYSVTPQGFWFSLTRRLAMDSVPGRVHWTAILPGGGCATKRWTWSR